MAASLSEVKSRIRSAGLFVLAVLVIASPYLFVKVRARYYDRQIPSKAEALWTQELERLRSRPSADPSIVRALEALQAVVAGKVIVDPNCGGACTKFCTDDPSAVDICSLALDPEIFRAALRTLDSDSIGRKAVVGMLIKEGETIRSIRDNPPMQYELVTLENYFDAVRKTKSFPNQLRIEVGGKVIPADLDTVARILLAKLVEMESVGYFTMARYLSSEGLSSAQLKQVLNTTSDRGFQGLLRRAQSLMKAAESPAANRDLAIRVNVMEQEIESNHPAVRQWVVDHVAEEHGGWLKYKRSPDDFAFLQDRKLVRAQVIQYVLPTEVQSKEAAK